MALICLLPYLNKAYTIDDPCFLLSARQVLQSPLQPMSYELCWMGNETCLKRAGSLGPGAAQALMGYLLVPVILAGGREWIAHLLQVLLAILAVFEMVRLTLRLGLGRAQACAAGLMLVAVPPFLSMANTAMPDTAALAFGLTGLERLMAWKEERRWRHAAAAGVMLGLAPYARPHLALLIPLGGLWLFDNLRLRKAMQQFRREAVVWMPLILAGGIFATLVVLTRDHGPKVETTTLNLRLSNIPPNFFAYALYLAFPTPLAVVWLAMNWRKARALPALLLVAFLVLEFTLLLAGQWPAVVASAGLATLALLVVRSVRSGDRLDLLLSLWILTPLPVVIYAHFPPKYMLGIMPAIVIVVIRQLSRLPRWRELAAYGALTVAGAGFSCVLLRADADFAESGRRAAAELITPYVLAGEKVWYGGQWGFYWYAMEAGARISKPTEPGPRPGELLAVGIMESGNVTRDRFPNRELIASRHFRLPYGRTMGHGAGLYSNRCGLALWLWLPDATNDYELWRIR